MDRFIRQPVIGTWAHRPAPAPDGRDLTHDEDPRGWGSHHTVYQHSAIEPPTEAEIVDIIRIRAYEVFLDRTRTGRAGSADGDWLTAERQVRAAYHGPHHGHS
jgi:hypothetical protein